ncbi:hypothetical protein HELRODRAFT_131923, partial [Helobdella robusta]|uniref:Histone-lysine N-methyltransferase n=1 Tax=Helobdella robusta TaxID=6412 RepID=T1EHW6_HELRO
YLVKWKGWSNEHNTWESRDNLLNCLDLVTQFEKGHMMEKFLGYSKAKVHRPDSNSNNSSNSYGELNNILKTWESEMNSKNPHLPKIIVENNVDFEGPPTNFVFITERIASRDVLLLEDPIVGCDCAMGVCYKDKRLCSGRLVGWLLRYDKKGLLNPLVIGNPIYECNKRCSCSANCINRVVQKGRKYPVSIFRTSDGRGWGVKSLEKIPKGAFVEEYIGEVILSEEAEKRGQQDNSEGLTYLFDLDFYSRDCAYTVDAKTYGNVSHFINHSCDPNLAIFNVWVDNLDIKLPRLALFAIKDIKMGEELTFDYHI